MIIFDTYNIFIIFQSDILDPYFINCHDDFFIFNNNNSELGANVKTLDR